MDAVISKKRAFESSFKLDISKQVRKERGHYKNQKSDGQIANMFVKIRMEPDNLKLSSYKGFQPGVRGTISLKSADEGTSFNFGKNSDLVYVKLPTIFLRFEVEYTKSVWRIKRESDESDLGCSQQQPQNMKRESLNYLIKQDLALKSEDLL